MNKKLQSELLKLDRTGFRELELAVGIARNFRQIMAEHQLADDFVMERLGIEYSRLQAYRVGAFSFTINDIAGIDAMGAEQEIKRMKSKSMLQIGEGK
jgi:hypothetical protein